MITDSEDRSMIAELEQIIQTEEAKPEAERDADLIDECIREIAELKGVKADFSEEEIDKVTDKLVREEKCRNRKQFIRHIAGIAAALVIVSGVTACAINPALINWIVQIVKMPFGTSIESENITFTNQGITKEYKDITDFLVTEKLDIYYPSVLPDNIRLVSIDCFSSNGNTFYTFFYSDQQLCYTFETESTDYTNNGELVAEIDLNSLHFEVYKDIGESGNIYCAVCELNETRYTLQCNDMQDIILVIGGLRKDKK